MRVLAVTNIYPTPEYPFLGTFVGKQIEGLRKIGLRVDVMYVDRRNKGIRAYLSIGKQVRAKIKSLQPNIVHVMYGGVLADRTTRAVSDTPTVVTFHGSDLLGEHLSGTIRKVLADYGVLASRNAARRATAVILVWKGLQVKLPHQIDQSKVKVIPCGIDIEQFRPLDRQLCREQLGWAPDRFHVLFPANTGDQVKRPELAQAAVGQLGKLGVVAELHYLRGIPYNEVPVWMNASDVLLLTSFHEGSPTVVKEALACNVPIVSVDVGDVRDMIEGIEGCYISLPQECHLAHNLAGVFSGPRRIAARERIQGLSFQQIAVQLKQVYEEISIRRAS